MAANAVAARESERAEENSEGSPLPTLEPALHRALSLSSRADNKRGCPSIGQSMNPPKNL